MQIINLDGADKDILQQLADLLVDSFKEHWATAWVNLDSALQEVQESLAPDRISRIAVDEDNTVLGWIGGISQYSGNVWELHPLVVHSEFRRQGIGSALVLDLENKVRERGGITLWLGTDDEDNMTSLSGVDLYPNVWKHIANIKNLRGHPYEFYQKLGFVIVGVMPDANGVGKPDIYMAKSLRN
ncbi:GNAT family N-acetyltransferase [Chroogloeocystis siderophila]|uniref:N-acetyltransferase n=1 Tax=Chroogloeocystis siderophila 5.2 s.c.1 TaxID=247279 RepID=A0A1U7HUX7_9CHRO|nr:GNAT family N-acetyltransferase [Chroogloeocystis siderophila]OKH27335.1 N-acetyltransferase [Chroogloeocystis siderophila 5.2 s.c.1]